MNILDIIILLIIGVFAIAGWKNGVIKEAVSLVGLILVFVIAYTFKEEIGNILCKYMPFFTFRGNIEGLVSLNILIYQLLAFLFLYSILYGVYQIILKISGVLQKIVNITVILAIPSKIGGLIVGALQGYIVIFALLMVLIIPLQTIEEFSTSKMVNAIVYKTPLLSAYTSDINKTIGNVYTLADQVANKEISTNDANLEIIDTMIDCDIVSKKTVEQLIVLDKLKTVKGLDEVLEKH